MGMLCRAVNHLFLVDRDGILETGVLKIQFKIQFCRLANYSTTNSSGTSSVAPGGRALSLLAAPHGGEFVAFCTLLKLIPTYVPWWGRSGFTLTGSITGNSERPIHSFPGNQFLRFLWRIGDQEQVRTVTDHFASSVDSKDSPQAPLIHTG